MNRPGILNVGQGPCHACSYGGDAAGIKWGLQHLPIRPHEPVHRLHDAGSAAAKDLLQAPIRCCLHTPAMQLTELHLLHRLACIAGPGSANHDTCQTCFCCVLRTSGLLRQDRLRDRKATKGRQLTVGRDFTFRALHHLA